jgi:recombination protein RecA
MNSKLVARSGTWFRYGDLQLGQSREKAKDYLRENPKLAEELRQKILEMGATGSTSGGGGDSGE